MKRSVPRWLDVVCKVDRAVGTILNAYLVTRDEIVLGLVPREDRGDIGAALYARNADYGPGGRHHRHGLFEWEQRLLAHPSWPRRGRVLIAGAGGGREARVLVDRGYEVTAFDPCDAYAAALEEMLGPDRGHRASHADLVEAASRRGPLASLARERFDGVIYGWASISHLPSAAERDALVRATAALWPSAPIIASCAVPAHLPTSSHSLRLRRLVRRGVRFVGAQASASDGEYFHPSAGFVMQVTDDELTRLARAHGYEVAVLGREPCLHALLTRA